MSKVTKAQKIEAYDQLVRERDLYQRYFWDQQKGVTYDVASEADGVKLFLFRLNAAHGGYVIVDHGVPQLHYWEEYVTRMARELSHHESVLPLRIAIERAQMAVWKFHGKPTRAA